MDQKRLMVILAVVVLVVAGFGYFVLPEEMLFSPLQTESGFVQSELDTFEDRFLDKAGQDFFERKQSPGGGVPECRDHIDNDGDGYCDTPEGTCNDGSFPGDVSCSGDYDGSEAYPPSLCQNGEDDDDDTFIDMNDPDCETNQSSEENNDWGDTACTDGIDNDNDSTCDYYAVGIESTCGSVAAGDMGCEHPWMDTEVLSPGPNGEETEGIGCAEIKDFYSSEYGFFDINFVFISDGPGYSSSAPASNFREDIIFGMKGVHPEVSPLGNPVQHHEIFRPAPLGIKAYYVTEVPEFPWLCEPKPVGSKHKIKCKDPSRIKEIAEKCIPGKQKIVVVLNSLDFNNRVGVYYHPHAGDFVVVNSRDGSGTKGFYPHILAHELGHAVFWFTDEYSHDTSPYESEVFEYNYGWNCNYNPFDYPPCGGRFNDVGWVDLIDDERVGDVDCYNSSSNYFGYCIRYRNGHVSTHKYESMMHAAVDGNEIFDSSHKRIACCRFGERFTVLPHFCLEPPTDSPVSWGIGLYEYCGWTGDAAPSWLAAEIDEEAEFQELDEVDEEKEIRRLTFSGGWMDNPVEYSLGRNEDGWRVVSVILLAEDSRPYSSESAGEISITFVRGDGSEWIQNYRTTTWIESFEDEPFWYEENRTVFAFVNNEPTVFDQVVNASIVDENGQEFTLDIAAWREEHEI